MRIKLLLLMFLFSQNLFSGSTDDSFQNEYELYEAYFNDLTIDKQIKEFLTWADEYYIYADPPELDIAYRILTEESGLRAIPYLKKEYKNLNLAYCGHKQGTALCDQKVVSIIGLISDMVWVNKGSKKENYVSKPLPEDTSWFVEETKKKLLSYLSKYGRVDFDLVVIFQYILVITEEREVVIDFIQSTKQEKTKIFYDTIIKDFSTLRNAVGIPRHLVFEGYEGKTLAY